MKRTKTRTLKNQKMQEIEPLTDVIPAFLAPDHISNNANENAPKIRQTQEKPAPLPDIIDLIDKNAPGNDQHAANGLLIRERLHDALQNKHISVFMQPVVTLPQRKVKFYEFFGRLRLQPGQYMPATDYMLLANEEHITAQLDTVFLSHCLKILRKQLFWHNEELSYFINIKPHTLRHNEFMNTLLIFLAKYREIADALIFEMHYNEFLMLSPAEKKILSGLEQIGCRFSLDHLEYIPTDVKTLRTPQISFLKIDTKILLREGRTERGFSELLSKKYNLDVNRINLIAEKCENEKDLKEILDFDINYGQGFLFGRPDFQRVYTAYNHAR